MSHKRFIIERFYREDFNKAVDSIDLSKLPKMTVYRNLLSGRHYFYVDFARVSLGGKVHAEDKYGNRWPVDRNNLRKREITVEAFIDLVNQGIIE